MESLKKSYKETMTKAEYVKLELDRIAASIAEMEELMDNQDQIDEEEVIDTDEEDKELPICTSNSCNEKTLTNHISPNNVIEITNNNV